MALSIDIDIGHHYRSIERPDEAAFEAWLWDEDSIHEAPPFVLGAIGLGMIKETLNEHLTLHFRTFDVVTGSGIRKIVDGEWLIKLRDDCFYIVKHEDFANFYKAVVV